MKKSHALLANILLLLWFVFDMTGLSIRGNVLVEQAWQDDGIFMVIFFVLLLLFVCWEKIGKYLLTAWLIMWFVLQFLSHWSFTIADWGIGSDKIEYYANTVKVISSTTRYIPDLYHIVEHILLLIAIVFMLVYCLKSKKSSKL